MLYQPKPGKRFHKSRNLLYYRSEETPLNRTPRRFITVRIWIAVYDYFPAKSEFQLMFRHNRRYTRHCPLHPHLWTQIISSNKSVNRNNLSKAEIRSIELRLQRRVGREAFKLVRIHTNIYADIIRTYSGPMASTFYGTDIITVPTYLSSDLSTAK